LCAKTTLFYRSHPPWAAARPHLRGPRAISDLRGPRRVSPRAPGAPAQYTIHDCPLHIISYHESQRCLSPGAHPDHVCPLAVPRPRRRKISPNRNGHLHARADPEECAWNAQHPAHDAPMVNVHARNVNVPRMRARANAKCGGDGRLDEDAAHGADARANGPPSIHSQMDTQLQFTCSLPRDPARLAACRDDNLYCVDAQLPSPRPPQRWGMRSHGALTAVVG